MEALLGVARRSELQSESMDARDFLLEAARIAMPDQAARVAVEGRGDLEIPRREALLLVSGLLRKVARQPPDAVIHVRLDGNALLIEKPSDGAVPAVDDESLRSDIGRGSALLDRLAQRLGWQVDFQTPTLVRIRLHD
jgi:hypothetical protein